MTKSLLYETSPKFFNSLLQYRDVPMIYIGKSMQYRIQGFDEYNYLNDINLCFSDNPSGDIIDRTKQISMPFNFHIDRPWIPKKKTYTLEECFVLRVNELLLSNQKLNLFWSGGIDSTAMLVGFLKHCPNLSQLRVLYSTLSMKENPGFFLDLLQVPDIELIEFSGDVYMNQQFDGLFISADGADDITASLDSSFYDEIGYEGLHSPWRDFFYKKMNDINFVNFCEEYFSASQRPITSILEARWWFYAICKIQKFPAFNSRVLNNNQPLTIGFFDTEEFETFTYYKIDTIIEDHNYRSYKQFLKDYIYEYDKDLNYKIKKEKVNSGQLMLYAFKAQVLKSTEYIMLLRDGTRIRTDNLPMFSKIEFQETYGNSLDYLFNC